MISFDISAAKNLILNRFSIEESVIKEALYINQKWLNL